MAANNKDVNLVILRKDVEQAHGLISRLEVAIEKIGEVAGGVAKIIAVHDQRIGHGEKTHEELFVLAERRRMEIQDTVKDIHDKIDHVRFDLQASLEGTEQRIMEAINTSNRNVNADADKFKEDTLEHKEEVDKRIRALENWRWMLVGGGVVLGFVMGKVPGVLGFVEILKAGSGH